MVMLSTCLLFSDTSANDVNEIIMSIYRFFRNIYNIPYRLSIAFVNDASSYIVYVPPLPLFLLLLHRLKRRTIFSFFFVLCSSSLAEELGRCILVGSIVAGGDKRLSLFRTSYGVA